MKLRFWDFTTVRDFGLLTQVFFAHLSFQVPLNINPWNQGHRFNGTSFLLGREGGEGRVLWISSDERARMGAKLKTKKNS